MLANSKTIKKFGLKCTLDDSIPLDVMINDLAIHIADFHFELPSVLIHENVLVISTKDIEVPVSLSYLKVVDIKETLVYLCKATVTEYKNFEPQFSDFISVSPHAQLVLKKYSIAEMNKVDAELLLNEHRKVQNVFKYRN